MGEWEKAEPRTLTSDFEDNKCVYNLFINLKQGNFNKITNSLTKTSNNKYPSIFYRNSVMNSNIVSIVLLRDVFKINKTVQMNMLNLSAH